MNHVIIKIESGVVADVYCAEPVMITVVDHDVIEGGESLKDRMKKAVFTVVPEQSLRHGEIEHVVRNLVLECHRPADERIDTQETINNEEAA